jgi:predicted ABC-type sugar transport system permease subunit
MGIEVQLLPAIGEVVLGGVFNGLLAGAVAGGAAGGIVGALIAVGMAHERAKHLQQHVRAGRIIVTVWTDERYDEALAILRAVGAELGSGDPLI